VFRHSPDSPRYGARITLLAGLCNPRAPMLEKSLGARQNALEEKYGGWSATPTVFPSNNCKEPAVSLN
jgi:hypothetical protein